VGVEALRYFWQLRHSTTVRAGIPRGRWIAAPVSTARLLRHMLLQNITDYRYALALHNATQLARDLVMTRGPWDAAPALLRRQINEWDVPGAVHATIKTSLAIGSVPDVEYAISDWVTKALTSRDRHAAALESARSAITASAADNAAQPDATEPAQTPAPEAPAKPARTRTPDYSRRPSAKAVKTMSGTGLAPYVEAWLGTPAGKPTISAVGAWFRVGDPKARAALETLGHIPSDRPAADVIQIGSPR